MPSAIRPALARTAVSLHGSHPTATARELLDIVVGGRAGSVADFGPAVEPGQPFALLVAEAFDTGMAACDWEVCMRPGSDPVVQAALRDVLARIHSHTSHSAGGTTAASLAAATDASRWSGWTLTRR